MIATSPIQYQKDKILGYKKIPTPQILVILAFDKKTIFDTPAFLLRYTARLAL